ncbi:MAG: hypothetical protein HY815_15965 [Candidatus Riflebacteria bacterium]|nr:hypothetical protein [Candidatus Riflebacteria bacterium]
MMQAILAIHSPRWVKALFVLGMVLVIIDLSGRTAICPFTKAQAPVQAVQVVRIQAKQAPMRHASPLEPRFESVKLACGCRVDYADNCSPPCSIRFTDGSVLLFDHRYRASSIILPRTSGGVVQFNFDDRDRVVYARHDPYETMYHFGADGKLKEVRHHVFNEYAKVIQNAVKIERGVRTRHPHELAHPHVPADSAMGHVLAGTWKAFER